MRSSPHPRKKKKDLVCKSRGIFASGEMVGITGQISASHGHLRLAYSLGLGDITQTQHTDGTAFYICYYILCLMQKTVSLVRCGSVSL